MFLRLTFLVILFPFAENARILAIIPTPSYSHQVGFQEIWRQLSLRGHQVTLITTDPLNDPKLTSLTEIGLSHFYVEFRNITDIFVSSRSFWQYNDKIAELLKYVIQRMLSHPTLQELAQSRTIYDVVLVENLLPELLIFGKIFNCPTVLLSSSDLDSTYYQALGNPTHPVSHPHFYLPFHGSLSFPERIVSTLHYLYMTYYYKYISKPFFEQNLRKYFNVSISMDELLNDVDLIFFTYNPVIHGPRALSPGMIYVDNCRPSTLKSVEKGLKEFMDNAEHGFIYFSLGSNAKIHELDKDVQEAILETMMELPYKIVYRYEHEIMSDKLKHVKTVGWVPQRKILNHPNIKLFVTQGGRESTEEAVYASVPMVVLPFMYDQGHNAIILKKRGIAEVLEPRTLKKDELLETMIEVISNPRYKSNVKKLRKLALDFPMTGLERAIWWTEYVIRNKGAKQLRNPAADLPLHQFFLVDVIGFIILLLICILSLVYFLVKKLLAIFRISPRKNIKRE